jgi:ABC-2 type transport system ATP-binding protein
VQTPEPDKLKAIIERSARASCAQIHDHKVTFCVASGEREIPEIVNLARDGGVAVTSISLHRPTLDDVFLHYTGKTIREENVSAVDSMRMRRKAFGRGRP